MEASRPGMRSSTEAAHALGMHRHIVAVASRSAAYYGDEVASAIIHTVPLCAPVLTGFVDD